MMHYFYFPLKYALVLKYIVFALILLCSLIFRPNFARVIMLATSTLIDKFDSVYKK